MPSSPPQFNASCEFQDSKGSVDLSSLSQLVPKGGDNEKGWHELIVSLFEMRSSLTRLNPFLSSLSNPLSLAAIQRRRFWVGHFCEWCDPFVMWSPELFEWWCVSESNWSLSLASMRIHCCHYDLHLTICCLSASVSLRSRRPPQQTTKPSSFDKQSTRHLLHFILIMQLEGLVFEGRRSSRSGFFFFFILFLAVLNRPSNRKTPHPLL